MQREGAVLSGDVRMPEFVGGSYSGVLEPTNIRKNDAEFVVSGFVYQDHLREVYLFVYLRSISPL